MGRLPQRILRVLRTPRRASSLVLLLATFATQATCRRAGERTGVEPSAGAAAASAPQSVPVESADVGERIRRPESASRAVIWIGLDGLDWEILDRLAAEGKMPNWSRLVAEGYSGRLTAFMPILSPILWTTAATGVGPDVHRILDFQEVDPGTGQKVPISGLSRAVPAIWNVASAGGKTVGVVGWWATHPAEEVHGFFVTDHASPILYEKLSLSGAAYPPALESGVAQILSRDGKVAAADLAPFLEAPAAEVTAGLASGEGMENRFVALARILAATRVYHRIARELYDKNHPDLMMLYLEGTDEIGHVFAPVSPPRLACVSDEDFARFRGAAAAYYAVVDRILGQWMRRAAEDHATLLVHSDHGFKWGEDRSCGRSSLGWSTAAFWHRPDGVFAAWGAGVRPGKASSKASMFDVAPTVLSLLGLPRDRKMTGHPIAAAFDSLPDAGRKDWSAAVAVRRVAAAAMSATEAAEYTKKLLALGYLSGSESKALAPPGGDRPGMTEGAWNNLGLYERETVKSAASAREAFEKSLALSPGYHSPMFNLAILYRDQGEDARAREWLYRSFAAGHAEPEATLAVWVRWYQENRPAGLKALLDEAVRHYPDSELLARQLAVELFRGKDCAGGYALLAPFETKTSDPDTLNSLALLQTCLGRREEAIALLERSLAIKPGQPGTIRSLEFLKRSHPPNG